MSRSNLYGTSVSLVCLDLIWSNGKRFFTYKPSHINFVCGCHWAYLIHPAPFATKWHTHISSVIRNGCVGVCVQQLIFRQGNHYKAHVLYCRFHNKRKYIYFDFFYYYSNECVHGHRCRNTEQNISKWHAELYRILASHVLYNSRNQIPWKRLDNLRDDVLLLNFNWLAPYQDYPTQSVHNDKEVETHLVPIATAMSGLTVIVCDTGMHYQVPPLIREARNKVTTGHSCYRSLSIRKIILGRDTIAANYLTFSNEFSWMTVYEFCLRFHWSFVSKVCINNIPVLVQIMVWRRPGYKPLSEPMMVILLTDICVTRP